MTVFNIISSHISGMVSVGELFAHELIDKEDDRYFIPDRSLELWLGRM